MSPKDVLGWGIVAILLGASFLAGESVEVLNTNRILHVDGHNQEIRVQGPVSTVIFDAYAYGNMVISDRGQVKQ